MDKVIQLKVRLDSSKPEIWRRLLVSAETSLFELHFIIQIAMGWTNSHLYEFSLGGQIYGTPSEEDDESFGDNFNDASDVTLKELGLKPNQKISYLYDFGDNWKHTIRVEKYEPPSEKVNYPICVDGEQNCPPEDCGGIYAYYNILDIIKTKGHPERNKFKEWLGGHFDPGYFDIKTINRRLKKFSK